MPNRECLRYSSISKPLLDFLAKNRKLEMALKSPPTSFSAESPASSPLLIRFYSQSCLSFSLTPRSFPPQSFHTFSVWSPLYLLNSHVLLVSPLQCCFFRKPYHPPTQAGSSEIFTTLGFSIVFCLFVCFVIMYIFNSFFGSFMNLHEGWHLSTMFTAVSSMAATASNYWINIWEWMNRYVRRRRN